MPFDRRLLDRQKSFLGRVDHAALPQHDLVFQLGGKLLGEGLVSKSLGRNPIAVRVEVLDVIGLVLLALVAAEFANRCHRNGSYRVRRGFPRPDYTFITHGAPGLSNRTAVFNPLLDLRLTPARVAPETDGLGNLPRREQPP